MCDLTDVFVQQNVFDLIKNDKPYISSENNTIENCQTNTTWINLCYNSDVFNILRSKEILNGGMYLGTKKCLIELFKELCLELSQIISRIGNYLIPDQAALNKLVYFDFHRYNIVKDYSLLNLAHHSNNKSIELKTDTFTIESFIPSVVHQYKVNDSFANKLYSRFL
jgi:ADP-glucose pyrophosphorylase